MRIIVRWAAATAFTIGLAATGAEAMPVMPPAAFDAGSGVAVRDGCGPFGHRSHFGYCKPNGYGPGPGYGSGYGPGPGYGYRPRYGFYGGPRYVRPAPRRCFIRETYYGPRRVCRW